MQIVASSFLALAAMMILLFKGPYRGLWVLLAMTAFGAAAAFNLPALGGASILVADIAALTVFGLVACHTGGANLIVGSARFGQPGFWLLLLLVYAIFAGLMLPRLFAGATEVFTLSRDTNGTGIVSVPLRPGSGNLTQLFRILLGAATFYAVASVFRVRPDARMVVNAIAVVTVLNLGLGLLDVATFAIGKPELMEPIRSANYSMLYDVRMAGLKRMIGGYPEASSYGYYSIGFFGFWLMFWLGTPASRRTHIMLAISAFAVLRSTSSAAYVAFAGFFAVLAVVLLLAQLRPHVGRRGTMIALALVVASVLIALVIASSYQMLSPFRAFMDRALFTKLDGDSGVERMSWNAQALVNFAETWGLGAGLGSVRASNWLVATLGSMGLIGTGLFLAFVLHVLVLPARGSDPAAVTVRSLRAACLALLVSAMLTAATPDLGLAFFAFAGLATGLSRGTVLQRARAPAPAPQPRGSPALA